MNIILDTCSLINLINSRGLDSCAKLDKCTLFIGPIVLGECSENTARVILELVNNGSVKQLSDDEIPIDIFLGLLANHNLGEGETECIACASNADYIVCSDDRQARCVAKAQLGFNKIIGSARLLKWCVDEKLLICGQANAQFLAMKNAGGFLPKLPDTFFCT